MRKDRGFTPVEIIIGLLIFLLIGLGLWFLFMNSESSSDDTSPTPTPTTEASNPTPTTEPTQTEPTPTPTPDPTANWNVYTNAQYGYQFRYPDGATITETAQSDYSMSTEEADQGVTFEQLFNQYGEKICVSVSYGLGYANFSAAVNNDNGYVMCHRSGVAYEYDSVDQALTIEGNAYTATGLEEKGPGETLDKHNETLSVTLPDENSIEFGSTSNQTDTYQDYINTAKETILLIVQSYETI